HRQTTIASLPAATHNACLPTRFACAQVSRSLMTSEPLQGMPCAGGFPRNRRRAWRHLRVSSNRAPGSPLKKGTGTSRPCGFLGVAILSLGASPLLQRAASLNPFGSRRDPATLGGLLRGTVLALAFASPFAGCGQEPGR